MKILLVTTAYPSRPDDPRGTFIRTLALGLQAEGARVTVLAPGAPGAPSKEQMDGVEVQRARYWSDRGQVLAGGVGGIVPNLRARPWLAAQVPGLLWALRRGVRRLAPGVDLVHAHWVYPSGWMSAGPARDAGRPLVVTAHGGDLNLAARFAPLGAIVRRTAACAARCTAVSHAMVEAYGRLDVPQGKVTLLPLGVAGPDPVPRDPALLARARALPGLRVLFVGGLSRRKGVDTLVSAMRILAERGTRASLIVVGDGPERRALEAGVGNLAVLFAGDRPPGEIGHWVRACDLLVLPSRSEGRGLVLVEAMQEGSPVISSDIPGPDELVHDDETGYRFPVDDANALADRLVRLTDPAVRARLGAAGKALVGREGLDAASSARRHLALYREILG